jgi:hypothetical protein
LNTVCNIGIQPLLYIFGFLFIAAFHLWPEVALVSYGVYALGFNFTAFLHDWTSWIIRFFVSAGMLVGYWMWLKSADGMYFFLLTVPVAILTVGVLAGLCTSGFLLTIRLPGRTSMGMIVVIVGGLSLPLLNIGYASYVWDRADADLDERLGRVKRLHHNLP